MREEEMYRASDEWGDEDKGVLTSGGDLYQLGRKRIMSSMVSVSEMAV